MSNQPWKVIPVADTNDLWESLGIEEDRAFDLAAELHKIMHKECPHTPSEFMEMCSSVAQTPNENAFLLFKVGEFFGSQRQNPLSSLMNIINNLK